MEREVLTLLRGAAKAEAPQQQKPAQQQKPEEKAVSSATADIPVGDTSNNATTQIQQTADDKQQPLLPPLEIQYTADNKPLLPPRKIIATNFPVYYMHIGKTGGSSVCGLMKTLNNKKAFRGKHYLIKGQNHFDWSFIQQDRINSGRVRGKSKYDPHLEEYDVSNNTDVLTFLRNPVQRAISQFYYAQRNGWVASKKKREPSWNPKWTTQTMDEYMNDTNKDFMQPLSDGEGGVRWLAGTWKRNDWLSASDESDTKRYRRQNKTAAALLAAQRLASTTWFGLLEEKDRSMKLLQLTLDLDAPPTLPKANSGHNKVQTHNETTKKIESYLPQDMWLYEYAKRLFEARWEYYFAGDGTYTHPELPPLPIFSTDAVQEAEVFFANQQQLGGGAEIQSR